MTNLHAHRRILPGVLGVACATLTVLCTSCTAGRAGGSPNSTREFSATPSRSSVSTSTPAPMPTVRLTLPMATGDYANAVRAAQRHGLRVWLESDLVKKWQEGPPAFQTALNQLGSLAKIPASPESRLPTRWATTTG